MGLLDVGEDVGGGLVLDFDLLGGVFGGEVVVFAQFAGGDGPGVVAGGAGLIQLQELGQVGVGDAVDFLLKHFGRSEGGDLRLEA